MRRPLLLVFLLACGCAQELPPAPPTHPEPMAVTGSKEVVIFVPTMVCESCSGKVTEGLALLPWVESESIVLDRARRQMRFRVKNREAFDPEALVDTVGRKGFKGAKVLVGPT